LFISFNFKCPYHASVIKVFEQINKNTVKSAFFIFILELKLIKPGRFFKKFPHKLIIKNFPGFN
jgi:hypothetical protein